MQDFPGEETEGDPPRPSSLSSPERARVRALTSSLSLQEAFLQRKLDFVEQSQKRMEQLKINTAKRQHTQATAIAGRTSQTLHMKRRLSRGHGIPQTTATFVTSPGAVAKRSVSKSPGEGVRGVATGVTVQGGVARSPGTGVRKVADHQTVQSATLGCARGSPHHEDGSGE